MPPLMVHTCPPLPSLDYETACSEVLSLGRRPCGCENVPMDPTCGICDSCSCANKDPNGCSPTMCKVGNQGCNPSACLYTKCK
eukprot:COSAG01_NODE_1108_length_11662_cov_189.275534_6_plen_83_part_00